MRNSRREFLKNMSRSSIALGLGMSHSGFFSPGEPDQFFDISLAEFSFASELWQGRMSHLDFASRAKKEFGIDTVEYVSMFFNNKHTNAAFLKDMNTRAGDAGVKNHLIMVDGQNLSDLNEAKRKAAVENHYPWVDAAKTLGCSAIRVNLGAMDMPGSAEDEKNAAIDGYGRLLEYADKAGINVIVENHMGRSCNALWLVDIMKQVNHPRAGVLPDFGNFCIKRTPIKSMDIAGFLSSVCLEEYDRYKGVEELMPFAKGVSAKTHKFKEDGSEHEMDFRRLFTIIKQSGFKGFAGIEYEGGLYREFGKDESYPTNADGIKATKALLEKMRKELS